MNHLTTLELLNPAHFEGQLNGKPTKLYLLRNANGVCVAISNVGAKVLQIAVPDRDGQLGDVTLGYDSLESLQKGLPSMGAFVGRYAGRITNARFSFAGSDYILQANAGQHCLHGGPNGSRHQVFEAQQEGAQTLKLQHLFEQHIDGFPGTVQLQLSYHLGNDNALTISHYATTTAASTPLSFTSHVFFNLDGQATIGQHRLDINADQLLKTDADNVCVDGQYTLDGHLLDLRTPRTLDDLPDIDHSYVLAGGVQAPQLRQVASLCSPLSGRQMETWTTEPVMQVYTGGMIGSGPQADLGKNGLQHKARAAICLEPQRYPNAMNCQSYPLCCATPDQPYEATTVYKFGVLA